MKDSFVFRKEWKQAVSELPNDARLEFYEAVISYGTDGTIPDLSPIAKLAFNFAKTTLDRDSERYEEIRQKRSEAGAAGNRKRWGESQMRANANTESQMLANVADSVSDNVGDSVSKEKLSKEKPASAGKTKHSSTETKEQLTDEQQAFIDELRRDFPSVMSMQQPLTFEQCQRLADSGFGTDQVRDVLGQMENFAPLKKKYKSAYATALNWLKRNGK